MDISNLQKKPEEDNKPKFITTDTPLEKVDKQNPVPTQSKSNDDDGWVETKKVDPKLAAISTYNGAATSKYNWSQGVNDVTVQVPIPEGLRAKQVILDKFS